ncbi:MAG: hypothetical protein AAGC71_06845 [Pseudomonadota bacterium]
MTSDDALRTTWRRSARGIFRDAAAEQLDLALAGRMRLVGVSQNGLRVLYVDLAGGAYRELRFLDAPDGLGGSATLHTVSVDYVKSAYHQNADFTVEES